MSDFWITDKAINGGNGYYYLDWFGWFNINSKPIIYHTELGWFYPDGDSLAQGMYIYSLDLGYLWTSKAIFPWLYNVIDQTYIYYVRGSKPLTYFVQSRGKYETYQFNKFATEPKDIIGYGFPSNWMWFDPLQISVTLVANKCTATYIDWCGCNSSADPNNSVKYWGYWQDKFDKVAPKLTLVLDALKAKKITAIVPIIAWNYMNGMPDPNNGGKPSSVCSSWLNDEWFMKVVNYFKARGPDGLMVTPFIEPGHGKPTDACLDKMWHWKELFDAAWPWKNKLWNGGGSTGVTQSGYGIEYHAQHTSDNTPAWCIMVSDGPVQSEISSGEWPNTVATPSKVTPYFQKLHNEGKGCIYWSGRVDAYIDTAGIKAVGAVI